jgi:hypothetical protein
METIDKWHKTRQGHLVFGLVELGLSYLFASLSIDSGSLLQYAITIILLVGAVANFLKVIRAPRNDQKRR